MNSICRTMQLVDYCKKKNYCNKLFEKKRSKLIKIMYMLDNICPAVVQRLSTFILVGLHTGKAILL